MSAFSNVELRGEKGTIRPMPLFAFLCRRIPLTKQAAPTRPHRIVPLLALFLVTLLLPSAPGAAKPNVIFILTDDQGSVDAGCYGARDLETPAIDALAQQGVRFTQFYAAAPVCSPSRAGLLTGKFPFRAGLTTNAGSQPGGGGLPANQVTMAELFERAGYTAAHIGKWHLGYQPDLMPNQQGFDYSFGHMGGCIDNYSHFFYWQGPNRHDLYRNGEEVFYNGQFFPDLMVEEAGRFMEEHRERPFFIYFAINAPHYPYQGDPKWLKRYRNLPHPRNLYAAFLSAMDERIGALVDKVNALGLRENTIIVFQSDHGHSTEERAHGGGGDSGPYRGAKFSLFEGGIRVPAIISWPTAIPSGTVRHQIAHSADWLPTLAELCGLDLRQSDLDGKSIVPVIYSQQAPTPHEVLHWSEGRHPNAQWAVRQGDWKLIGNPRASAGGELNEADKNLFLSNLAEDISEKRNYAADFPEVVGKLRRLHEEAMGQ